MTAYLSDPRAIYAESFRAIGAELAARGTAPADPLTVRLVHACGMVDIVDDLEVSPGAVAAGQAALAGGAAILCDAEMVARGVIMRQMPDSCRVVTTLNEASVPGLAAKLGTTRSAAAVELWHDLLADSVVAIGNAPTALFHLLERLDRGWPRPALIVGMPVGFVGAAEAKQALSQGGHGVPFITIHGRRGGSALAAAAVNALTLGTEGDGT